MLAAIQAPIILMSQKRGAERDRLEADIDHEVNVRAELAIRQLDDRLHSIEKNPNVFEQMTTEHKGQSTKAMQRNARPACWLHMPI